MKQNPALKDYASSIILDYFLHLEFAATVFCESISCRSFQEYRNTMQRKGTKQGEVVRGNIKVAYNFHGAGGEVSIDDTTIHFGIVIKNEYNVTPGNVDPFVCIERLAAYGIDDINSFWKACEDMNLLARNFPKDELPPVAQEIEGFGGYKASWVKEVLPHSVLWGKTE